MLRIKTYLADGSNPNGRLFAGDLNALQDAVAALTDLAQALSVGTLAVGESGLQLVRYGAGEARVTGALRSDGLLRGLGGMIAGAFTTTARNGIATGVGLAPYGTIILNTTTNQYEWNKGTDTTRNWQPVGSNITAGVDVLANRPAANSVAAGSTYFATDQIVDYISDGSSWIRRGVPAGSTVDWFNATAPTGWVTYDGGTLPASTGIYADIFAHLGSTTTKPDTRGRATYGQGSHSDVGAIGANDGVTLASRTPQHNSSHSLTLPNHIHSYSDPGHVHTTTYYRANGGLDDTLPGKNTDRDTTAVNASDSAVTGIVMGNPTSLPAIPGAIGPGGSRPNNLSPWITTLKIAKL